MIFWHKKKARLHRLGEQVFRAKLTQNGAKKLNSALNPLETPQNA